jgi:uncharacterized protein (DUF2252 family)
MIKGDPVRELVASLNSRDADDPVELLDAAYWVKGCSSLGRLRYAALLRIGAGKGSSLCLIDIKEGVAAAAPRASRARTPRDNAVRVVTGVIRDAVIRRSGISPQSTTSVVMRPIPDAHQPAAVLASVKDKPFGRPTGAVLDRRCARRPHHRAGRDERTAPPGAEQKNDTRQESKMQSDQIP